MDSPLALVRRETVDTLDFDYALRRFCGRWPSFRMPEAELLVKIAISEAELAPAKQRGPAARKSVGFEATLLFDLVRRLKAALPFAERNAEYAGKYVPAGLIFAQGIVEFGWLHNRETTIDWLDEDQITIAFEDAWHKARFAEGEDPLETAFRVAVAAPVEFKEVTSVLYGRLLGTAFYLQAMGGANDIILPQPRLGVLLRITPQMVSKLIDKAIRDKYLTVTDSRFVPGTRAKRYRFRCPACLKEKMANAVILVAREVEIEKLMRSFEE
jgi:hypothetical protein